MTYKCYYALNAAHDDHREIHAIKPYTSKEWSDLCRDTQGKFDRGELSEKCGADADLLMVHRTHVCIPYCVRCAKRDLAVVDGHFILLRLSERLSGKLHPQYTIEFEHLLTLKEFVTVVGIWNEFKNNDFKNVEAALHV